jgi:hypothetical protein
VFNEIFVSVFILVALNKHTEHKLKVLLLCPYLFETNLKSLNVKFTMFEAFTT